MDTYSTNLPSDEMQKFRNFTKDTSVRLTQSNPGNELENYSDNIVELLEIVKVVSALLLRQPFPHFSKGIINEFPTIFGQ